MPLRPLVCTSTGRPGSEPRDASLFMAIRAFARSLQGVCHRHGSQAWHRPISGSRWDTGGKMSQKSVEDARFPHDVLARIARHAAKVPVLAVFGICAASASPADARSCPPVAWRLPTPPAQLASGVPPSGMLSALGVFRRAQIPPGHGRRKLAGGIGVGSGATHRSDLYHRFQLHPQARGSTRKAGRSTSLQGRSVAPHRSRSDASARLPARTKLRLLHLQREDRTRGPVLIYDEVQPGFGSAFHAYSLTDLQAGDITTAGVGGGSPTNPNEDAWGLVPDSVASVSVLVEHGAKS